LFRYWFWFVPAGSIAGYLLKGPIRRGAVYVALCSGFYFLIISLSKTKLEWYAVPLYPLLALLCALLIYYVVLKIRHYVKHDLLQRAVASVVVLLVIAYPYFSILKKSYYGEEYDWDKPIYPVSYILQQVAHGNLPIQKGVVCYEGYNTHLLAYMEPLKENGKEFNFGDVTKLSPGDIVIASQSEVIHKIESAYEVQLVQSIKDGKIFKVVARK